jgi:TolB-like protein/Flp pilus assembly protein TadD
MALVFTGSVEEPAECALEISRALRAQPSLPVRMGIHSGPIQHVKDASGRENIAGIGINIAQRVMDCGDAGHILVSKRVAGDLAQQRRWQPYLHELGDVEVKHGVVVSLVNLYAETIGNPTPPSRLGKDRSIISRSRAGKRKGLSPFVRAIFITIGLVIALIFLLAIVSVIFAPAIMRTLDQHRSATLPQPTATAVPSLADTIKNAVAKQITDELQGELSHKNNALKPPISGSAVSEKSIAVLPFENLSEDKSNAYFAEGVQDEILTRLAKVSDLKVISRTSTQHFKSTPDNLPEIAKQLGVTHILEGSVQKADDQIRVNVQLINALTDAHLWAETFDRKLTDIFAIESEIAKTIADTLQAKLSGSEKTALSKKPTENQEAHELYLKGRYFWNRRTEADIKKALDYFQQAIQKDSSYALAYAGLADCYSILPGYSDDAPKQFIDRAIPAARRAIELDNSLAEAHTALANALGADLQLAASEAEFKRAFALNSNYASAHQWYGEVLQSLGRFEESIAELRRAHELDPLSLIINNVLASVYYSAGRNEEAWQQIQRTIDLDPSFGVAYWVRGQLLESKGEFEQAVTDYKKSQSAVPKNQVSGVIACAYVRAGKRTDGQAILSDLISQSQRRFVSSYPLAQIQSVLGNTDEAIRLLEKAYDERSIPIGGAGTGGPKIDNRFDPLRGDPRFQKLLAKFVGDANE